MAKRLAIEDISSKLPCMCCITQPLNLIDPVSCQSCTHTPQITGYCLPWTRPRNPQIIDEHKAIKNKAARLYRK